MLKRINFDGENNEKSIDCVGDDGRRHVGRDRVCLVIPGGNNNNSQCLIQWSSAAVVILGPMYARSNKSQRMVFLKDISNKLKGYLFQVSYVDPDCDDLWGVH